MVLVKSFVIPLSPAISDPPAIHKVGFSKDGQLFACLCRTPQDRPYWGDVFLFGMSRRANAFAESGPFPSGRELSFDPMVLLSFSTIFTHDPPYAQDFVSGQRQGFHLEDNLAKPAKRPITLKPLDGGAEIEPGGVHFSMDDKFLAVVRKDDKSLNVWEVRSGDHVGRFALPVADTVEVRSVSLDPTNRYVAAGVDY